MSAPLTRKQLDDVLQDLIAHKGLPPSLMQKFLQIETEDKRLTFLVAAAPFLLVALYVVTFSMDRIGAMPNVVHLPNYLHEGLQALHNMSGNEASRPELGAHIPAILGGTLLAAFVGFGYGVLRSHTRSEKIIRQQTILREALAKGEAIYNMKRDHTAAFVGDGDWFATLLAQSLKPEELMQYAYQDPGTPVWQLLERDEGLEGTFEALDRGDFASAGEMLIMPIERGNMFLPGTDGHDMTLDEIASIVQICDAYCVDRGIKKKRLVIVASQDMSETYLEDDLNENTPAPLPTTRTLKDLAVELERLRQGTDTDLIDPTRLTIAEITTKAAGRKIIFKSTKESNERYAKRFRNALSEYKPKSKESVVVYFNITDIPTSVDASDDGISVVLDASMKDVLMRKGVHAEHIIVVPELIVKQLHTNIASKVGLDAQ